MLKVQVVVPTAHSSSLYMIYVAPISIAKMCQYYTQHTTYLWHITYKATVPMEQSDSAMTKI